MPDLKSKFEGVIVGCAVGDALGAPFEGYPRGSLPPIERIIEGYVKIPGYPLGQYTDDTQLTVAIAEAIIETGRVDADAIAGRFVELWKDRRIVGGGAACSYGVRNLMAGVPPSRSGSEAGRAGNGAAMRASPVGLWLRRDKSALIEASRTQSVITHQDERAAAGAAAVAMAVGLLVEGAELQSPDFIEEIASAAGAYSPEFAGWIRRIPGWVPEDENKALVEISAAGWSDPSRFVGGITPFVIPTVLAAIWQFLRFSEDWPGAIARTIRLGGDVDTTGAICGAIAGAYLGINAIPGHLVDTLKDSEYIRGVALQLYEKDKKRDV